MNEHTHDWKRRVVRICDCGAQESVPRGRPRLHERKPHTPRAATRARWQRWAEMYQSGMSGIEVAAQEGVTQSAVFFALRKLGVPYHRGPSSKHIPEGRVEEVVALYRTGLTYEQIGKRYGVSRERVRQWLVKAGFGTLARERIAERVASRIVPTTRTCKRCGQEYEIAKHDEHFTRGSHLTLRYGTQSDPDRWEGMAADYAAGMRLVDIQTKWSRSGSVVMRSVRSHGIPLRRPEAGRTTTRAESIARKARIRELRAEGKTQEAIAAIIGCSSSYVNIVLRAS